MCIYTADLLYAHYQTVGHMSNMLAPLYHTVERMLV